MREKPRCGMSCVDSIVPRKPGTELIIRKHTDDTAGMLVDLRDADQHWLVPYQHPRIKMTVAVKYRSSTQSLPGGYQMAISLTSCGSTLTTSQTRIPCRRCVLRSGTMKPESRASFLGALLRESRNPLPAGGRSLLFSADTGGIGRSVRGWRSRVWAV